MCLRFFSLALPSRFLSLCFSLFFSSCSPSSPSPSPLSSPFPSFPFYLFLFFVVFSLSFYPSFSLSFLLLFPFLNRSFPTFFSSPPARIICPPGLTTKHTIKRSTNCYFIFEFVAIFITLRDNIFISLLVQNICPLISLLFNYTIIYLTQPFSAERAGIINATCS